MSSPPPLPGTPGSTPLRPRVGLLAVTLEFYEQLAPDLRPAREAWLRREAIPALSAQADVLFEGAVFRREDLEAAVQDFERRGADALLVVLLTYAPSQLALKALKDTRLPVAIWNTQERWAVDATFGLPAMLENHGVHGTQDLASVLLRQGVPFHYVTSHLSDPHGLDELHDFLAAAAAVRRLRRARLGLLGYPFPGMGDFALDTTRMTAELGCSWTVLTMDEFLARWEGAAPVDTAALANSWREVYDVAPGVTDADLQSAARAELALRGLVDAHRLDALTYQFMAFGDDPRAPTLPFVAASRLMAEGIGFGGEGDLVAAAGTAFLNWLCPPASFTEIFTIDFAGNALFLSHMGEANVAMARRDRRVPLVARPTPIVRTRDRQLALLTSFEPGPATLAALAQGPGGRWRWLAATVEIEDYGPRPDLFVPHSKIRVPGDVRDFLTAYALAGGPHHNALCFGDARRRLQFAARSLGAEYCLIGDYAPAMPAAATAPSARPSRDAPPLGPAC